MKDMLFSEFKSGQSFAGRDESHRRPAMLKISLPVASLKTSRSYELLWPDIVRPEESTNSTSCEQVRGAKLERFTSPRIHNWFGRHTVASSVFVSTCQ